MTRRHTAPWSISRWAPPASSQERTVTELPGPSAESAAHRSEQSSDGRGGTRYFLSQRAFGSQGVQLGESRWIRRTSNQSMPSVATHTMHSNRPIHQRALPSNKNAMRMIGPREPATAHTAKKPQCAHGGCLSHGLMAEASHARRLQARHQHCGSRLYARPSPAGRPSLIRERLPHVLPRFWRRP